MKGMKCYMEILFMMTCLLFVIAPITIVIILPKIGYAKEETAIIFFLCIALILIIVITFYSLSDAIAMN